MSLTFTSKASVVEEDDNEGEEVKEVKKFMTRIRMRNAMLVSVSSLKRKTNSRKKKSLIRDDDEKEDLFIEEEEERKVGEIEGAGFVFEHKR